MENTRDRALSFLRSTSASQKVVIVVALAGLAMLGFVFFRWVTSPSYTVLYANLDEAKVAEVIDGLETAGVPYELEQGGSTVLVPRNALYETRASLAAEGVTGSVAPEGYELLDSQGLSVSDFRQRVDYQRALEGELSKTLAAMDGVNTATVRLVLPEDELFAEEAKPASASVLLDTARELSPEEVETVTYLVSSGVEALDPGQITVADTDGTTLHAPGDTSGANVTNRNQRQTREYEQQIATEVEELVAAAGGGPASVVVRAEMNFDERDTTSETFDPESQVALREQTKNEEYAGTGAGMGGIVGVDGGPIEDAAGGAETDYAGDETLTEYGVDKTVETTQAAPGTVEALSVAIVMDDGTQTGAAVPAVPEVERLVTSAMGLQADRGDTIAVTPVPFPEEEPEEAADAAGMTLTEMLTLIAACLVLVIVAVALFLMTRRRGGGEEEAPEEVEWEPVPQLAAAPEAPAPPALPRPEKSNVQEEVRQLVTSEPDQIAALLRTWLADRRA